MGSKKILCTGARGFIGRRLVPRLVERGDEVWALLGPGDEPDPGVGGDVHWVRGDITDPSTLKGIRRPFSIVYHLAGLVWADDPARFYRVNTEGTVNLARAILEGGGRPDRFVFSSSYGVMGPALDSSGLNENSPCRPVSDYGRSKLEAELFLRSMSGDLPVTIVRLPLVYGPGSKGGLYTYFRLISKGFCPCLAGGEATLGFVDDMVSGIILAAETPGTEGETFLLGDEGATSIEEIVTSIEEALGKKARRVRIPVWLVLTYAYVAEKLDVLGGRSGTRFRQNFKGFVRYPSWRGDVSKARERLGFRARVPFPEGARTTAAWYRHQGLL